MLHSQAHDNNRVVLIYFGVLSVKGNNLGSLLRPPRMLTATFASSSCLPTSARGGLMKWRGGRGWVGRGSLQLRRGEVEVEEEAEGEGEQIELATLSPSPPS